MRDFPVFTTEYGVASLVLREIPYREEAYIIIQSTQDPEELLKECIGFCRACGAEKIYARGHEFLEGYPLYSIVYEMRGEARVEESLVEHLWPVTEDTVGRWRQLLNQRLANVDNAGTLDKSREREILSSGGAYYVHHNDQLLGAGWIHDGELKMIAAIQPGAGRRVLHTLMSLVPEQQMKLQVVSSNVPAIRLYESFGFIKTGELYRWYRVH